MLSYFQADISIDTSLVQFYNPHSFTSGCKASDNLFLVRSTFVRILISQHQFHLRNYELVKGRQPFKQADADHTVMKSSRKVLCMGVPVLGGGGCHCADKSLSLGVGVAGRWGEQQHFWGWFKREREAWLLQCAVTVHSSNVIPPKIHPPPPGRQPRPYPVRG